MALRRIPEVLLRGLACAAALAAGGCFAPTNRPWLAPNEPAVLHSPGGGLLPSSDPLLDEPGSPRAGSALAGRLSLAKPTPDPRALHDMVVELQAVGAIDPAAQAQLLQDLERTNPSLWPEVMQSFRTKKAKSSMSLGAVVDAQAGPPGAADAALPLTSKLTKSTTPTAPWSALAIPPITRSDQVVLKEWPQPSPTSPSDATMLAASGAAAAASAAPPTSAEPGAPQAPAVSLPGAPPAAAPGEPRLLVLESASPAGPSAAGAAPVVLDAAVRQAGFTIPAAPSAALIAPGALAATQDAALAGAITALEATLTEPVKSAGDASRHAYLRLLYLAAGRREEALRPIAGLSPTEQDYWDKQLRAMATWLDVERIPDPSRRAAEASQRLAEASTRLAQLSALGVRNMAFCTDVSSYGVYTRFKDNNFAPGQQVLLYAEVENFKSVETHRGYHTMLKSSYQILDAAGNPVAKDEPQAMEEYCQNPRRDYFVRYRLHLPQGLTSGRYRLQLTICDTLGEKSGVSNIDFSVTTP